MNPNAVIVITIPFVIFLALVFIALVARFVKPLNQVYPFARCVLRWSLDGFLLANLLWLPVEIFLVYLNSQDPDPRTRFSMLGIMLIIFGTYLFSAVGLLIGSILGVWFAVKARQIIAPAYSLAQQVRVWSLVGFLMAIVLSIAMHGFQIYPGILF